MVGNLSRGVQRIDLVVVALRAVDGRNHPPHGLWGSAKRSTHPPQGMFCLWRRLRARRRRSGMYCLAMISWTLGVASQERLAILVLVIGVICLGYSMCGFGLIRIWMPQLRRQVSKSLRHKIDGRMALVLYGIDLGFGASTRITSGAFFAAILLAGLCSGSPLGALLIGFSYGISRALAVICVMYWIRESSTKGTIEVLERWDNVARVVVAMVLSVAAGQFTYIGLNLGG
jgi:cytochrome c biogenesis protein CcdA